MSKAESEAKFKSESEAVSFWFQVLLSPAINQTYFGTLRHTKLSIFAYKTNLYGHKFSQNIKIPQNLLKSPENHPISPPLTLLLPLSLPSITTIILDSVSQKQTDSSETRRPATAGRRGEPHGIYPEMQQIQTKSGIQIPLPPPSKAEK